MTEPQQQFFLFALYSLDGRMTKMRNYKIAATVRHSGRYIEHELAAMDIDDANCFFRDWLFMYKNLTMDAISELDITETGESE